MTVGITGEPAHAYYDSRDRPTAARVREDIDGAFEVNLGRWREAPAGRHPISIYQVAFAADQFARLVPWPMLDRGWGSWCTRIPVTTATIMTPTRCDSARTSRSISTCLVRDEAF